MKSGRKNSWSFVARTYLFDQMIQEHVNLGYELIINLASGLDTRPYRLPLPSTVTWIDIDLPEIITYMQSAMIDEKPNCELQRISLDLSDREARLGVLHELGARNKKTLVVTEGLMGYLDDVEAGALAYDLSHVRNFSHWVMDIMSPAILPLIRQEMASLLDEAGAPLLFAPVEGEDFFPLFGWKPVDSRSKLKTAALLKRLSAEMMQHAALPEPPGPKRNFPWSGVCLFENIAR